MRLFLVRHPRVADAENICYGQSDLDCAPGWREQLAETARLLPTDPTVQVVASPLIRCRLPAETWCAQYGSGRGITWEPDLKELHFGAWEGRSWSDIDRAEIDRWALDPAGFAAPAGESLRDLSERVSRVVARWAEDGGDRIVFCHSGVIRVLATAFLGMPIEKSLLLEVDHLSVSLFEWHAKRPKMRYFNRI